MTVDRWLTAALEDAERRGLPELKPLLQGLASSIAALRTADWNERADGGSSDKPAPSSAPPTPTQEPR